MADNSITTIQLKRRVAESETRSVDEVLLQDGEPLLDQKGSNHLFIKSGKNLIEFPNISTVQNNINSTKNTIIGATSDSSSTLTLNGVKNYTTSNIQALDYAETDALTNQTTPADNNYVISVTQADGKINVKKSALELKDNKVLTNLKNTYTTVALGGIPAQYHITEDSVYALLAKALGIGGAPSYKNPSVEIRTTAKSSYEAGAKISVTIEGSFNVGSYQYGPSDTGCDVTAWYFKDFDDTSFSSQETSTKTYSEITIGNTDALSGTYTYTIKASYDKGADAYGPDGSTVYKNSENKTVNIPAGTTDEKSTNISWYWNAFAGSLNNTAYSKTNIRTLLPEALTSSISNFEFTAEKGHDRVIFAYPSSITKTPRFEMFTMSWGSTDGFKEETSTIEIAGATDSLKRNYTVWQYKPVSPFAADTKFRVSLSIK